MGIFTGWQWRRDVLGGIGETDEQVKLRTKPMSTHSVSRKVSEMKNWLIYQFKCAFIRGYCDALTQWECACFVGGVGGLFLSLIFWLVMDVMK